jgi:hypothetical protein
LAHHQCQHRYGGLGLVADLSIKLESLISIELELLIDVKIGADHRAWVPERPRLVGWPTRRGGTRKRRDGAQPVDGRSVGAHRTQQTRPQVPDRRFRAGRS